jgi:protocatechuate 3,4-dioxygenase alpha subunit
VRTPSQTVGPFFAICLTWPNGPAAVAEDGPDAITIGGYVIDGAGDPVPDALVETWQTQPERGFGRSGTDDDGHWEIVTRKAPYLDVSVFARGLLHRLVTRIYFPDETQANDGDPVLSSLEPADRVRLIAVPDGAGLRFDVRLQGDDQTPFFRI